AILLTDEQVASLAGGPKTPAVKVTVNGGYTFEGRIGRMGGENMLGFNTATRAAAGVEAGDTIEVVIVADTADRGVQVPDDLASAMRAAAITDRFDALAPSHRKEYVRWVTEAKKPETRAKRVVEAVGMIAEGRPRR
ncbi:MAG: YdeI/OmpD-associated family protein, partial [Ilumatobacteraceae bacterium]